MSMTIQSSVKDKILTTSSETSKYEYEIRYHPGKANVVIEALNRKERVKPRCDRAMAMTILFGVRGMILTAQSEAFKQENGMMRTVVMDEAHASSKEWNSGDDQLRFRWMIYFVVLADAAESVSDAIRFEYCLASSSGWTKSPVLWAEIGESSLIGPELVQETTDKVVLIKEKLKAARDRQKSCADNRRKPLEFEVGERVMLKVSPWKGVIRFGKKGKLAPSKTVENVDLKAQIQEKVFANAALKNELRKLKGKSVDTKFTKPSILGKPVLQPLRNQSVVRQPNAFKSERPNFSKPRFASQVDVNNVLSKPVTQHYLPKRRESAFAKPNHMIASSSSRNSSKNMPRFSSNDMVHNHYPEETQKKTQEKGRNSESSVMHSTRLQNTTNDHKPKPRSNNQTTRSLSKDEALDFIIKFLNMIQVRLKTPVRRIKTDNGTEFINQTLREYYEKVGISHEISVARSPQQNGVVERRNHTLIEAARTMLIYAKALLFIWAEAVATACYTQNRSIICLRYDKTPYEILHDKLPDLSFFHVFGALCNPTNDSENLGKLQPKADIGIIIGYAPTKKAFRIYNRRTRRIIKTIHVDFDELTAMASEHSSSGPALHEMTPATITPKVVAPIDEVAAPVPAVSTGLPSSTTVDQDAPSPSNSQTTPETQPPVIPNDVEEDDHDIEVAHMDNDPYFGLPIPEIPFDQSSSSDSIHTNVPPDH
ncbi:retrovirus-related pol polyprotein from transposon TNT 1-94 [Tanacetum coccineum]